MGWGEMLDKARSSFGLAIVVAAVLAFALTMVITYCWQGGR